MNKVRRMSPDDRPEFVQSYVGKRVRLILGGIDSGTEHEGLLISVALTLSGHNEAVAVLRGALPNGLAVSLATIDTVLVVDEHETGAA